MKFIESKSQAGNILSFNLGMVVYIKGINDNLTEVFFNDDTIIILSESYDDIVKRICEK